ncbi:hypothetical protein HMPREF0972_01933 [Actinomyces sp. oral taxon 848 str. F0332]|nr:hypothetical protein HMPREF0972_01933 [Actinomyces sp. oral taxon 848 str. F0332]
MGVLRAVGEGGADAFGVEGVAAKLVDRLTTDSTFGLADDWENAVVSPTSPMAMSAKTQNIAAAIDERGD